MNRSFCNSCGQLVPSRHAPRDGRVHLEKQCPDCGVTETLISSDAERYHAKWALDPVVDCGLCSLNCTDCRHPKQPNLIFVDITNRCNLNCPICINSTPSMGFLFEPPLEYFEKIFDHLTTYDPRPAVQLFGGEPTVRKDLPRIIEMTKQRRLPVRVVTNGVKLADWDYCQEIVNARPTLLIAYDGHNPDTYGTLRGSAAILAKKVQGIDNLMKMRRVAVGLMTLIAKGFNDGEIGDLFAFCHERQERIRAVYFMPLAHTWKHHKFDFEPDRTTAEDLENLVNGVFPGERVEFLPAGLMGEAPNLLKYLVIKPIPFLGAHPNCESTTLLISDGEKYVPAERYLKGRLHALAAGFIQVDRSLAHLVRLTDGGFVGSALEMFGARKALLKAVAWLATANCLRKNVRMGRFLRGKGLMKLFHALCIPVESLLGFKSRGIHARHTAVQGVLQLIILPFEDRETLETERMERCPCAFAYYDPCEDRVKTVPVCAWGLHKAKVMRGIAEYYGAASPEPAASAAPGGA